MQDMQIAVQSGESYLTAETVLQSAGERTVKKIVKAKRLALFTSIIHFIAGIAVCLIATFGITDYDYSLFDSALSITVCIMAAVALTVSIILCKSIPVKNPYAAKNLRRAGLAVESVLYWCSTAMTSWGFAGGLIYFFNSLYDSDGKALCFTVFNGVFLIFGIYMLIYCYVTLGFMNKKFDYKGLKESKKREREENELQENGGSTFTGGAFANGGINILTRIVSLITLGIAYPAMACWKLRWKASHTFVNGRRLVFDGKAAQFIGKYLLWLFLSVITLGIYYIVCMKVGVAKWQTKHIHFADTEVSADGENLSRFDGHWYQLLGVNWLCRFVTLITLSFGQYWAHCYKERWFCKHKTVDGIKLIFDGKAAQYFGKKFVWILLTIVTLGIYAFWLAVKTEKWTCSHTKIDERALQA